MAPILRPIQAGVEEANLQESDRQRERGVKLFFVEINERVTIYLSNA
jgi:hypothetical protein